MFTTRLTYKLQEADLAGGEGGRQGQERNRNFTEKGSRMAINMKRWSTSPVIKDTRMEIRADYFTAPGGTESLKIRECQVLWGRWSSCPLLVGT